MIISIPVDQTMEYINATEVSPLISHVQIKVCYCSDEPNRNGTIINKEMATKLGSSLPGCPIVGYYNEETKDFDRHNREVQVEDGHYRLIDMTKPYGFVPTNAKVWFQKFLDGDVEHEYLCTEGYIWTGIYEESKRVVDQGNNQSMELTEVDGKNWTNHENSRRSIFIINDGLIEKLCILGSNVEPCFEGAQITTFSDIAQEVEEFKKSMFSMIDEFRLVLQGGLENPMNDDKEYEKKKEEEEDTSTKDTSTSDQEEEKDEDKKEEKKKYDLNEIPEYVTLQEQYAAVVKERDELSTANQKYESQIQELTTFKLNTERKEKEDMIKGFYMLSDEDKKDVTDNIDKYSLDEIEAKLSIICVRNRVDFKLFDEKQKADEPKMTFNLDALNNSDKDDVPAWVKAVRQHS